MANIKFCDIGLDYEKMKDEIDENVKNVLSSGYFIMGPQIKELEQKLAKYVGIKNCISCSNGTDAIQMGLMALDVSHDDEVITVPFTWISTAEVINLVGAKPVFVDVDETTFNIDLNQVENAITEKTKAIIVVSIFGQMPNMDKLMEISKKHNIPVIEDAAQSFGAEQNGKKSCSIATISTTSFFPSKPFGGYGDGGAVFTNDDVIDKRLRAIRTHGANQRHHHWCIGMNCRLNTLQAGILLAKFNHIEEIMKNRNDVGTYYTKLIKEKGLDKYITPPHVQEGNKHVYAQYTLLVENREDLKNKLKEKELPTAIYYPKCLHEQPVYEYLGYKLEDFPNAVKASRNVLSLPMHSWISYDEIEKVVDILEKVLKE
jgi:UDP-2-acetamido-2-deoxy-ribo-hexuluronate aminotransferase